MSCNTVEEPTVVRNYNGTSGKVLKPFFQSTQGVDIDVVGRFVEQEHIGFFLKGHSKVQTIALTTRQHTAFLFLIGTCKVEPCKEGSCIDITTSHTYQVQTTRHYLKHSLVGINSRVALVNITNLDSLTNFKGSLVNSLLTHNHSKEGCFTGSVGTNNTYYTIWWQYEIKVFKEYPISKSFGHTFGLNYLFT